MALLVPLLKALCTGRQAAGRHHRLYNFVRSGTSNIPLTITTPPLMSSAFALLIFRMQWMQASTLVGELPEWMYRLSRGIGPFNGISPRLPFDTAVDDRAAFCASGIEALAAFLPMDKHYLVFSVLLFVIVLLAAIAFIAFTLLACARCRPAAGGAGIHYPPATDSAATSTSSASEYVPDSAPERREVDSWHSLSSLTISSAVSADSDASSVVAAATTADPAAPRATKRFIEPDDAFTMHTGKRLVAMQEAALALGLRLVPRLRSELPLGVSQALAAFSDRVLDTAWATAIRILYAGYLGATMTAAHALSFGTDVASREAKASFAAGVVVYVVYSLGFPLLAFAVLRHGVRRGVIPSRGSARDEAFAAAWGPFFNDYDELHASYFALVDLGRRLALATAIGSLACKPEALALFLLLLHLAYAGVIWFEQPFQVPSRHLAEGLFAVLDVVHVCLLLPGSGLFGSASAAAVERAAVALITTNKIIKHQHELLFVFDEIDIGSRGRTPSLDLAR
ncbi:uncharacterized protein AMSG_00610 [Thecamonas trahens ATCC 50062]|uniref:Uncharacterized protein n=1 Tax=Thecamonas trahens ATCC 50062 TaxID=461836 RepID=A0A0L0DE07_THETB|nr:hypothetical protein AMSG_00610 [Thecamonas trahens ATCC 50062]KNC50450.1 hypothetical protein AMSG_00610 [Thecamonas trahens ATCC 50062]|eukprot:XP_013762346.1 hypothetical protein AMSG_00610 [Thecamonas trahens ATCC 50062]